VNVYLTGFGKRDQYIRSLGDSWGAKFFDTSHSLVGGLSLFVGFDCLSDERMMECWRKGLRFLHVDHAYFRRGYEGNNMRVSVDHFHTTKLLNVPADRLKRFGVSPQPWKKGREVIVLAPSQKVCKVLGVSGHWAKETARLLMSHTDRPVRVKEKGPGLLGELKDCHAVVGLSSVAEVEAAVYGVPVFASEHSPASTIAERDFTKIETPIYPDREMWLRTLTYSQWHKSEMADGTTRRHLERVLNGDLDLCRASDGGKQLA